MPRIPPIMLGDDTNMPAGVRMYGHRIRVKAEPETASQRARLQNPRLKLHSALDPFEAMSRMLLALGRVGFDTVLGFRGPVVDPTPERKEGLHVRDVVAQLRALDDPAPPLGGLKAEVRYRRDERVRAVVTVGSMRPAKVKVRVKGAVLKSDWFALKKLVERDLKDIDA